MSCAQLHVLPLSTFDIGTMGILSGVQLIDKQT